MKSISLASNSSWYLYNFKSSLIKALMEEGYYVLCISPHDRYSEKLEKICSMHLNIPIISKKTSPFHDLRILYNFFKIYLKYNPMVCFHFTIKPNIYGAIAAKLLGLKVINNITGLGTTFIHNNFISMIVRLLYRISQPFADKVFCQNQDDLELLKNNGLVNEKKLILVPGSGIDIEKFSPINSTKKPNEIFTFVYIGRLLVDKGLRELVDAVCKLNKNKLVCRLEIYGEPDSNNISSIVDEELIMWRQYSGISLKGHTDEPELALMSADCVVLPSYREGMPRSLLEAGSMALPAVATNVPGCKHFITDGLNGYLCEAKDTRSLQLKMKLMLETSFEKRVAMGEASRAIILQKFDEKILINFVINLIESMDSSELNQA